MVFSKLYFHVVDTWSTVEGCVNRTLDLWEILENDTVYATCTYLSIVKWYRDA